MNDILVESLIESAKERTLAPMSQNTFEDPGLIRMATEELLLKLVSDVQMIREDYFLSTVVVPLIAGVSHYPTPHRAIGNSFTSLHRLSSSGELASEAMTRIDSSRKEEIAAGSAAKFYMEGDEVVISAPTQTSGALLFTYARKPNRLTATANCARITQVTEGADFVTFMVDTDLTVSLPQASLVDFLSARSPFLLWTEDSSILAISSNEIQVSKASVVNEAGLIEPKVGDYICPAGYSCIPMIPEEMHPVLAQMVAVRILAALGDTNKWQMAKAELKEVRQEALIPMKNRVQSSPKRVSQSRNGLIRAFSR